MKSFSRSYREGGKKRGRTQSNVDLEEFTRGDVILREGEDSQMYLTFKRRRIHQVNPILFDDDMENESVAHAKIHLSILSCYTVFEEDDCLTWSA